MIHSLLDASAVLASLFILVTLSWIYLAFGEIALVRGIFDGIKPAVVAIVVFAAWRIGRRALKNKLLWGMAGASFIAIFVLQVPFPYIVLGAGVLGYFGGRMAPARRLGNQGRLDLMIALPRACAIGISNRPQSCKPAGKSIAFKGMFEHQSAL